MTKIPESVVCPGCSCLCDDIEVFTEHDQITGSQNLCRRGFEIFRAGSSKAILPAYPSIRIQGASLICDYRDAVEKAKSIISGSRTVLFCGLTTVGYDIQKWVFSLSERYGHIVYPDNFEELKNYLWGLAETNPFLATLQEVKDKGDLLLFWRCSPPERLPRFLSRYALYPRGRYRERGFQDRIAILVDEKEGEGRFYSYFVPMSVEEELGVISRLNSAIEKDFEDPKREEFSDIIANLSTSSFISVVVDARTLARREHFRGLLGLCQSLNRMKKKCMCIPLIEDFNWHGIFKLMMNSSCTATAIPDIEQLLRKVDAVVHVGSRPFDESAISKILVNNSKPVISICSFAGKAPSEVEVLLPVAIPGVQAEARVFRMDGIGFSCSTVLKSDLPDPRHVLEDLFLHSKGDLAE